MTDETMTRADALYAAVGSIDADLIDEARPVGADGRAIRERKPRLRAAIPAAAAAAVLILLIPVLRPQLTNRMPRAEGEADHVGHNVDDFDPEEAAKTVTESETETESTTEAGTPVTAPPDGASGDDPMNGKEGDRP